MDELHADDVGRSIALSERFAAEGEMNLSKLLDAAVYADLRRSGWMHRPAVTRATMEGELRTTIERLKARHAEDGLIAALELDSAKLARGDHRDMLVEEAPDVFVSARAATSRWGRRPSIVRIVARGRVAFAGSCPSSTPTTQSRPIRWQCWRSWPPTPPTSNDSRAT